ncbi:MAG TPA: nitrogenase component 1 [Lachnospiraceae bacterium]|nr:nitrogenase component 1 [Lachnospiraceae bacterium]
MKGLMKYLSPFAPDISGAAAVLFEMKGLVVIIDAGGCAGNVCGFDEPRWFRKKSAVFSAGLRDLDAILGRDDKLMEKVGDALSHMDASFLALIGTPVPSVIATDFQALKRMGESRFGLPVLTVPTTGMGLYDDGAEKAYLALFDEFAQAEGRPENAGGDLGVLGATPLDMLKEDSFEKLRFRLDSGEYGEIRIFGEEISDFRNISALRENLVISPSGLAAAEMLKEKFGIPYTVGYPLPDFFEDTLAVPDEPKKILILEQAVLAETLRDFLAGAFPETEVDTATFFKPYGEKCRQLSGEDDFLDLIKNGGYDTVIADPILEKACRGFTGTFLPLPQFAVSGN